MSNEWRLYNEDCIPVMRRLAEQGEQYELAVFSPPFASLYCYSDNDADMGNSRDSDDEFLLHHQFFCEALRPLIKPGRVVAVHIQQVVRQKRVQGFISLWDIRGEMRRQYEDAGFVYWGEVTVRKCPQVQSLRTKTSRLQFTSLHTDSLRLAPALADYVMFFKAPGEAEKVIRPVEAGEVSNEDWIEWASPVWTSIKETNTLNVRLARSDSDERHMAPLQLDLIERVIRLYTERGETVFSPFGGIGSEGHVAVALGRKAVLCELKAEYAALAEKNLDAGIALRRESTAQGSLFGTTDERVSFQVKGAA